MQYQLGKYLFISLEVYNVLKKNMEDDLLLRGLSEEYAILDSLDRDACASATRAIKYSG